MFWELFWAAVVCLILWDYANKKRRNDILEKSKIQGPKPVPFFGNIFLFRFVNTENMFYYTKYSKETYGKIYRFWLLNHLNVEVVDCKYMEAILSSQKLINKSDVYRNLESWLGNGLLMSTGKKWYTRRRIITPTFHFKILEQFIEIFDNQANTMMEKLQAQADGVTPIDIYPIVCLAALDIIAESAMGVPVHAQKNPNIGYVQALAYVSKVIARRNIKPLERVDWLYRLLNPAEYKETQRCIKVMHDFTNGVIEQRRDLLQQSIANGTYNMDNNKNDDDDNDVGEKKRMALLDVLLQSTVAGEPLSNEDIREEVDTFMFEGHDTTTSGISFCLYLISRYPEVQEKLRAEIDTIFGDDKDRPATYKELQDLKYLECVIKESLRLYPPVPVIGRQTVEDTVIGNIVLPAKANVIIKLFMAMRDPDYFPDPGVFNPERFSADNPQKISPFAFTPFSAGPRNCIGQRFAMLEMKSTISKMLRHFELLPLGPQVRPITNVTLRSVTGVNLGLKPRT